MSIQASERWDVAVVGAGPAGAVMGLLLARAGHRVVLVDRRRFPRDKACGDALIPDALAALARLGLLARVEAKAARWSFGTVFGPFRASMDVDAEMLTIRRTVLDAELVAAATEAGAALVQGMATQIDDDGDRGATVRLADGGSVHARLVCVATGANVALLERCGMLERAAPSAVAIRTYVHSDVAIDRLVVSFDRRILPGYGWIFPMGDGAFNVGCGVVSATDREPPDLRAMLGVFLDAFPLGRALVRGERRREAVRGALLRYGLTGTRPHSGGAVFAVGEAVGCTFPLTGEGIGKAIETAELGATIAADALRAGSTAPLARYGDRLERELRSKYVGYEAAQRWIAVPGLADVLFLRARRSARVRATFSGLLNETVEPSRVISPGGLLRALLA